jgi:hypothetical protein
MKRKPDLIQALSYLAGGQRYTKLPSKTEQGIQRPSGQGLGDTFYHSRLIKKTYRYTFCCYRKAGVHHQTTGIDFVDILIFKKTISGLCLGPICTGLVDRALWSFGE